LIEEALEEILRDGFQEVIAIPMAPYRSPFSTNAYIKEVNRLRENFEEKLKISFVEGWHSHPLFLEAVRDKVHEGLMQFAPQERTRIHLIFNCP
jgi:ferrochelatase